MGGNRSGGDALRLTALRGRGDGGLSDDNAAVDRTGGDGGRHGEKGDGLEMHLVACLFVLFLFFFSKSSQVERTKAWLCQHLGLTRGYT